MNNHFADDTNNLYEGPSVKNNKKNNYKFNYKSRATYWLRADIISLNVAKTETILFCLDRTKIIKNFWIKGQKIKTKTHTDYL